MKKVDLEVQFRSETGTRKAKKLRLSGLIPGVVYGKGKETTNIAINRKDLRKTLSTEAGRNVIINLTIISDGKARKESVITHDIARDPITADYINIDFLILDMSKPIEAEVPTHLIGESPGAKAGGVLLHRVHTVRVKCLPDSIPSHFDIDISKLEINEGVMVKDVLLPQGVEIIYPEVEERIVVVEPPRAEEVIEEVPPEEEMAEPELVGEKGKPEEEVEEEKEGKPKEKEPVKVEKGKEEGKEKEKGKEEVKEEVKEKGKEK